MSNRSACLVGVPIQDVALYTPQVSHLLATFTRNKERVRVYGIHQIRLTSLRFSTNLPSTPKINTHLFVCKLPFVSSVCCMGFSTSTRNPEFTYKCVYVSICVHILIMCSILFCCPLSSTPCARARRSQLHDSVTVRLLIGRLNALFINAYACYSCTLLLSRAYIKDLSYSLVFSLT